MERATVHVTGIVQSVGFRPFVARTAVTHELSGTVCNRGDAGVFIEVEGRSDDIDALLATLRVEPPPLARIESISVDREPDVEPNFERFEIVESAGAEGEGGTIPPDTTMCDACLADMRDSKSRYAGYWATSCVDCGPRFTVIEELPYDRPATSMAAFPMCEDCRGEYEDAADRRYHAQTIACPVCGPTLRYSIPHAEGATRSGPAPAGRDPFPDELRGRATRRAAVDEAATAIAGGAIVAIKGIGGAHLAGDATDPDVVDTLRDRTGRPAKPFAVMAPDRSTVETFAHVEPAEREALVSPRRPILLLDERDEGVVSPNVAPGLHTVGVMLPYAGIHHLLFDRVDVPLVLTSANMPGQPMLAENRTIATQLATVADGFLLHDRRIVTRCDDSVERFVDSRRRLIRRSRGVAPTPAPVPGADPDDRILGLGPELDVTAGILAGGDCYLTQYVGDVDDVETFSYLREAIDHLCSITGVARPPVLAHDSHPDFQTTEYAHRLEREGVAESRIAVQHHHAHAASVLAEHGREKAIVATVDGVGYGPDGTVWGGEILDATRADFERVGGLAPMAMPGGDRATRYPGRMAAGVLYRHDPDGLEEALIRHDVRFPGGSEERHIVRQQLEAGVNTPTTTSAGRFLDAVSALLGVCTERTYEGEPAMKLEAVATRGDPRPLDPPFATTAGRRVLDAPALFARLLELHDDGIARSDLAATAQEALAQGLAELTIDAAVARDREAVGLTGGVAYNDHIAARIGAEVADAGLSFLGNERVPPGDGGIAYGQVAVAAARSR